jgi:hypothetical protein
LWIFFTIYPNVCAYPCISTTVFFWLKMLYSFAPYVNYINANYINMSDFNDYWNHFQYVLCQEIIHHSH